MNKMILALALSCLKEDFTEEAKKRTVASCEAIFKGENKKYNGELCMMMTVLNNVVSTMFVNILKASGERVCADAVGAMLTVLATNLKDEGLNIDLISDDELNEAVKNVAESAGLKVTTETETLKAGKTDKESENVDGFNVESRDLHLNAEDDTNGIIDAFKKLFKRK